MKNLKEFLAKHRIIILILVLTFIFSGLDILIGQTKTAPQDSIIKSVKLEFPKIYGAIVKEAMLNSPNDSTGQNFAIKMQCYCFTYYRILMGSDKYPIPKEDFLDISMNVLLHNSKYQPSLPLSCEQFKKNKQKLDCALSEMVVDWINVFKLLDAAIFAYNLHH